MKKQAFTFKVVRVDKINSRFTIHYKPEDDTLSTKTITLKIPADLLVGNAHAIRSVIREHVIHAAPYNQWEEERLLKGNKKIEQAAKAFSADTPITLDEIETVQAKKQPKKPPTVEII